jgi:hypothetical protein
MEKEGKKFTNISHSIGMNTGDFTYKIATLSIDPSYSITQETYNLKLKEWDYKKWDWAISNWVFNLTNRLSVSGNATYLDYFPKEKNRFITKKYFEADSLEVTEKTPLEMTLEDLDELEAKQNNWSITLNHTYRTSKQQNLLKDYNSELRTALNFDLTKNWQCSYSNTYDIKDKKLMGYNITLRRKLHCWQINFSYQKSPGYWRYDLRIFNLALDDALQLKTSDHN